MNIDQLKQQLKEKDKENKKLVWQLKEIVGEDDE